MSGRIGSILAPELAQLVKYSPRINVKFGINRLIGIHYMFNAMMWHIETFASPCIMRYWGMLKA